MGRKGKQKAEKKRKNEIIGNGKKGEGKDRKKETGEELKNSTTKKGGQTIEKERMKRRIE